MNILSIYLGHNSSMTVSKDGDILEVLELERMVNLKNCGTILQVKLKNPLSTLKLAKDYLMSRYNIDHFDLLLANPLDFKTLLGEFTPGIKLFDTEQEILNFFSSNRYQFVSHQHGHMACAFYQSDLDNVRGVSFDGGGDDGNFNIFECNRKAGIKQIAYIPNHTLGMRYSEFGQYAKSINRDRNFWEDGGLIYPGKLMGLASFGKVREEWIPAFEKFYTGGYDIYSSHGLNTNYNELKRTLNFPDEYEGELEVDIVATSQYMFESKFDKLVRPYFQNEKNFLVTGGCALNILNNQKLRTERKIFVPPNPHDGGLSLGFMMDYLKPESAIDSTYMGPEVWDSHLLPEIIEKYNAKIYNINDIVTDLMKGKIIGVVRKGSELGPRALGNRSIICHAAVKGMKDILNLKVKNREPYRPFAPVCRVDDAHKFFDIHGFDEHRWMSFCPKVRVEHRESLESITHVDGTARLQTVKDFQNDFLYFILTTLSERHEYPILINTSFNVAGKPILNTYRDAIWMLENTQMDALVLDEYYITKG